MRSPLVARDHHFAVIHVGVEQDRGVVGQLEQRSQWCPVALEALDLHRVQVRRGVVEQHEHVVVLAGRIGAEREHERSPNPALRAGDRAHREHLGGVGVALEPLEVVQPNVLAGWGAWHSPHSTMPPGRVRKS